MDFNFNVSFGGTIDIHVHLPVVVDVIRDVIAELQQLNRRVKIMSQEMDDLTAAVHEDTTVTDSVLTLVQGMADRIAAGTGDPAALTALATELRANAARIAAAVTANTPTPPAAA